MIAPRHDRTTVQEERIKQAIHPPLTRFKKALLEIIQIDEEIGVDAIIACLRNDAPAVLQRLGGR